MPVMRSRMGPVRRRGVAVGRAAFDSSAAQRLAALGNPVILVRPDTSTADVTGFAASAGILTAAGGRTAHAALVARQMGRPCVVGCRTLAVDGVEHRGQLAGAKVTEGDWISIDGGSGEVFLGQRDIVTELPQAELDELNRWRAGDAAQAIRLITGGTRSASIGAASHLFDIG
jgi:pyruvate, orthophosphate dikinase